MKCDIWMQLSLLVQDGMRHYGAQGFRDGRDASMAGVCATDAWLTRMQYMVGMYRGVSQKN